MSHFSKSKASLPLLGPDEGGLGRQNLYPTFTRRVEEITELLEFTAKSSWKEDFRSPCSMKQSCEVFHEKHIHSQVRRGDACVVSLSGC